MTHFGDFLFNFSSLVESVPSAGDNWAHIHLYNAHLLPTNTLFAPRIHKNHQLSAAKVTEQQCQGEPELSPTCFPTVVPFVSLIPPP